MREVEPSLRLLVAERLLGASLGEVGGVTLGAVVPHVREQSELLDAAKDIFWVRVLAKRIDEQHVRRQRDAAGS